nr:hypothetical protein [Streptomyces sp. SID8358]
MEVNPKRWPPPGYYGAAGPASDAARRGLILDWVVSRRIASGASASALTVDSQGQVLTVEAP